jgi:hypothetical protein
MSNMDKDIDFDIIESYKVALSIGDGVYWAEVVVVEVAGFVRDVKKG